MLSIQTNVNSLIAQQNLSVNTSFQSKTIQQLTSGYRINQSGDDAAGLAVANKFRSSVAELSQGVANGNDAVAQLQIMDGGMNNISIMLDRLKTLATQSASGTFTGDRSVLNNEFSSVASEIDRQAQSIGLNTGGTFAKSLSVYLGTGSGSQSLSNGVVTLGLTNSTVDSQSLGLKGMQVVNASLNNGATDLVANDIGASSPTSVQAIVSNTSGGNANQQAVAGYAAFQFSGAGFSDSGKVGISVNLTGVSNTATLATAINNAIQSAGNGGTAAADTFKKAGIVASVYTDRNGGQAIAFNSSSTAFQVQAGDQMANALLGKVSIVGEVPQGTAVTTSVTGGVTAAGTGFATPANVHLVVTGGGLSQAVSLQLNGASNTTSLAIADLQNQFTSSSALVAAGLTMSNSAGGSTLGGSLSFASATGQAFNVQVTGDTQNMLGLGSFLADSAGRADYTTITAGGAYSAAAVTGSLGTTIGAAAGLEISINGAASTALTPIDLTAGANASAAVAKSSASITGGAVDITSSNNALDISVVNNGATTSWVGTLSTNTVASAGAVASSTITSASSVTVDATHNKFQVAVDGRAAVEVTVANGTYTGTGASSLVTALNTAIGLTSLGVTVQASFDANNSDKLTFTSATTGAGSSVAITNSTTTSTANTSASVASGTITSADSVTVDATHKKFQIAVDGQAAVEVSVADGTYTGTGASSLVTALNTAIGLTSLGSTVQASFDANNGGKLTFAAASSGAASSVVVSNSATTSTVNTSASVASGTITSADSVTVDATHKKFQIAVDGQAAVEVSVADGTYTGTGASSLVTALNTAIGLTSLGSTVQASFDANNGGKLTFAAASSGAASSVVVSNSATTNTVNTAGKVASGAITSADSVTVDATHNTFQIAVDGGASVSVTVADGTYTGTGASSLVTALNSAIGLTSLGVTVQASFDADNGGLLTFTSAGAGGASTSVAVSNGATNDLLSTTAGQKLDIATGTHANGSTNQVSNDLLSTTAGKKLDIATGSFDNGSTSQVSNDLLSTTAGKKLDIVTGSFDNGSTVQVSNDLLSTAAGKKLDIASGSHNSGTADGPSTLDSIAAQIQSGLGAAAVVTVTNDSRISIAAATKGANSTVKINTPGSNSANATLNFTTPSVTAGQNSSIDDIVNNLNAQFSASGSTYQSAGLKASKTLADGSGSGNYITISSSNGTQFRLNALGSGATSAENVGFGVAGATFTGGASQTAATTMSSVDAYGTSATGATAFNAMQFGNEKQVLTFSATEANGTLETKSFTLQNNATSRAGRSIDDAIAYINQQLQASTTNPALQSITAVKEKVGGAEKINFISSLANFTVGVGGTGTTDGLNGGTPGTLNGTSNGAAANMTIDTETGAKQAVTAITAAIAKLGTAQAAIGKGENQLGYAINLAQSQITNFSAAESQIRDTNVAQQAANLSKAQVLQQASIAAMAQANSAPQAVLSLLKG